MSIQNNRLDTIGFFQGVRGKLTLSFFFFALIVVMTLAAFWWAINQEKALQDTTNRLAKVTRMVKIASNLEKDFFISETINTQFYETGESEYINEHRSTLDTIKEELQYIKSKSEFIENEDIYDIDSTLVKINQFEQVFDSLIKEILKRGFKSYGSVGDMRRAISRIYNSGYEVDKSLILSIRRHEKDYLLRKDSLYINQLDQAINDLKEHADVKLKNSSFGRVLINSSLVNYKEAFDKIVASDNIIGIRGKSGLRDKLNSISNEIDDSVLKIENKVIERAESVRSKVQLSLLTLFLLLIVVAIALSSIISSLITRNLRKLSVSIRDSVEKKFSKDSQIYLPQSNDEIKQVSLDVSYMLDSVKKRTQEVIEQKEQITEAYENVKTLQAMGQSISSELSLEAIIDKLYTHISSFVSSELFFVGIKDEIKKEVHFRGNYTDGKHISPFSASLNENYKAAVWVINTQEEIISGNFQEELTSAYNGIRPILQDEKYESVVYLPLTSNNTSIGVLSIQCKRKDAFTDYQISILKSLVLYAVSAIVNASMYEILEEKVEERTKEVILQKEEIEAQKEKVEEAFDNVKLLSDIGKLITSHLSLDKISEQVYQSINNLMDAPIFGIGLYNEKEQTIVFNTSIENFEKLPGFSYHMSDEESYSVWCIKHEKEIVIGDIETEYHKYLKSSAHLATDEGMPNSILYLPVWSRDRVCGVISVQSYRKHAYSEYHLNLLRNLSIYLGIALDNASTFNQIEQQRNDIEEANKKITRSINYASRIQNAILPSLEEIQKELPDSFVFYKPRDIVSGDFYWFAKKDNKVVIAAIDCTGHGVPGAFMSMIGNDILQHLVIERGLLDPGNLLKEMHHSLQRLLGQGKREVRDGMEVALCVVDKDRNNLTFAGANNPMLFIQDDVHGTPQLYRIKGEKYPIGGMKKEGKGIREFKTHSITTAEPLEIWANVGEEEPFEETPKVTETPTTVYLFSDGYQDQFGGSENKKFMGKQFRSLLYEIHKKPMEQQKQILENRLDKWMNSGTDKVRQLDDILVIGFKI